MRVKIRVKKNATLVCGISQEKDSPSVLFEVDTLHQHHDEKDETFGRQDSVSSEALSEKHSSLLLSDNKICHELPSLEERNRLRKKYGLPLIRRTQGRTAKQSC